MSVCVRPWESSVIEEPSDFSGMVSRKGGGVLSWGGSHSSPQRGPDPSCSLQTRRGRLRKDDQIPEGQLGRVQTSLTLPPPLLTGSGERNHCTNLAEVRPDAGKLTLAPGGGQGRGGGPRTLLFRQGLAPL